MTVQLPEIWVAGSSADGRNYTQLEQLGSDFSSLTGASVIKLYAADLMNASPEWLSALVDFLNANHIKLAVETFMVTAGPGQSGEGLSNPGDIAKMVANVQAAGGSIDYVDTDEALYRGHDVYGMSLSDLAENVAANVALVRAAFPNVRINDIEPYPAPATVSEILDWATAYQQATGTPLDQFTPDLRWDDASWQTQTEALSAALQANNIGLGLIFEGDARDASNAAWGATSEARMAAALSDPLINPQHVTIQSWQPFPLAATPDDSPGTMANVSLVTSMLAQIYQQDLLGFTSALAFTAADSLSVAPGGVCAGICLSLSAEDIARNTTIAVALIDPAVTMQVSPAAGAQVTGAGTGHVLLVGTEATINATLQSLEIFGNAGAGSVLDVEVFDASGQLSTRQVALTLGATGTIPTVPTVALAPGSDTGHPGDGVTTQSRPGLDGTADPGSRVSIFIDGTLAGTVAATAAATWSFTPATQLSAGPHTVSVTATDDLGDVSAAAALAVTIDQPIAVVPPSSGQSLTIALAAASDSGFPDDGMTDIARPTLAGFAPAGSTVTIQVDGTQAGTTIAGSNGAWTLLLSQSLALGNHAITADGAGGAVASLTLTIDTAAQESASSAPDPLFDAAWYMQQHPGIATTAAAAYQQFLSVGWTLGWDPSPLFSTTFYLTQNGDVANAGLDPLLHFEQFGWKEGRDPSPQFSVKAFEQAYPNTANQDPLLTYIEDSISGNPVPLPNISPDPLVDVSWYLATYPATAQVNSYSDFMDGGWTLGRNPDPYFDTTWYIQQNPDVAASGMNPLLHYEEYGWKEGRDPSPNFSTSLYLANNPDVAASGIDPLLEYLTTGMAEGRATYASAGAPQSVSIKLAPNSDSGVLGDNVTNDTLPLFTGMANAGSAVSISIDDQIVGTVMPNAASLFVFALQQPLSPGSHTVTALYADPLENVAAPTPVTLLIKTVTTIPTIALDPDSDSGMPGDDVTNVVRPTLMGTAEAGTSVALLVDGASAGVALADGTGRWSFTLPADLADGSRVISATATDQAGNTSAPASLTVLIDTAAAAPTIALASDGTNVSPSSAVTQTTRPTFAGTAEAGGTLNLLIDGVAAGPVAIGDDGAWSFTPAALSLGLHAISATETDIAGNTSAASTLSLLVGGLGQPSLGLAAGSDSGFPNDNITDITQPTLTGTAAADTLVAVSIDGVVSGLTESDANGRWSLALANPLSLGGHTLSATSGGAASSLAVLVDTAAQEASAQTSDPLFDAAWYMQQHPGVAATPDQAYQHFLSTGWMLGWDPNPLFSTTFYLENNQDVANRGIDPLIHFEQYGWKDGRDPSPQFSDKLYQQANPDITAGQNPLLVYVTRSMLGLPTGPTFTLAQYNPDPLVDASWYSAQYPQSDAATLGAYTDYMMQGWKQGLNPDPWFDTSWYLQQNPDVAQSGMNPLLHFEEFGWKEGRDPSPQFSTNQYLQHNPDVAASGVDPLLQYATQGLAQGRAIYPVLSN